MFAPGFPRCFPRLFLYFSICCGYFPALPADGQVAGSETKHQLQDGTSISDFELIKRLTAREQIHGELSPLDLTEAKLRRLDSDMWPIRRSGSTKRKPHDMLENIIFFHAELKRARMRGVFVRECLFDYANLEDADLTDTELEKCVFSYANLECIVLHSAVIRECSFENAHLEKADFSFAQLKECNFHNAHLAGASLDRVSVDPGGVDGGTFEGADLTGTTWGGCDLKGLMFSDCSLDNGEFGYRTYRPTKLGTTGYYHGVSVQLPAKLEDVMFIGPKDSLLRLRRANFRQCNLRNARFEGVDATDAIFTNADLTIATLRGVFKNASFVNTNLEGAHFDSAELSGAIFEPPPKKLPYIPSLVSAKGLSRLRYKHSPNGLTELRAALKDAGMRSQEREVSYALETSRLAIARERGAWAEYWFNFLLFDVPCEYGLDPGRPLRILVIATLVFTIPYFVGIVLRPRARRAGLWIVRSDNPVRKAPKTRAIAIRIKRPTAATRPRRVLEAITSLLRATGTALYFSVLSASSIGYREINLGSWISRLQSREYTLRATGWLRCVSGFQSLLSVYLLALWVLTYFGRPFE